MSIHAHFSNQIAFFNATYLFLQKSQKLVVFIVLIGIMCDTWLLKRTYFS